MPVCFHCKTDHDHNHYDRVVRNVLRLHGPWEGWRMSGRFLIAPRKAGRITPELLGAQLYLQTQRAQLMAMTRPRYAATSDMQP